MASLFSFAVKALPLSPEKSSVERYGKGDRSERGSIRALSAESEEQAQQARSVSSGSSRQVDV